MASREQISSLQNRRIKALLRLKEKSRDRRAAKMLLVEGVDEIKLALAAGHQAKTYICAPSLAREELDVGSQECLEVTTTIFRRLSQRENPDGWLGVFARPVTAVGNLDLSGTPLMLVLEAIEKPGNLGAVLRTADAAGVQAVLVCDPRVDAYSPNVVRASRGTIFSVPVVETTSSEAMTLLRDGRIRIVAADANAGVDYQRADLRGRLAIALGTEDVGLSQLWLEQADIHVRIPMQGKVNSLNVSVAAALLMYEALRQRRS